MPLRAHPTDAGMDLYSVSSLDLAPSETYLFDTGVAIAIPEGCVGLVFNRSSQGKIKVQLNNAVGVIDSDYRGNIKVLLTNNGTEKYSVEAFKTRIAQLVIVPIILPELKVWVGTDDSWFSTVRNDKGFGSTG